jgi:sigma-B regulation protein RsbU (phosphoserine phosphatase)
MSTASHSSNPEDRVITDAARAAAAAPVLPPSGVPRIHARLLVVDDDVMNVDLLKVRLEIEGYDVATAANGRQALEHLRAHGCDLVLLDIVMPEMDGYAVLQTMKSDATLRNLPVIMISGLDDLNSVAQCIELGADDYLPKPFKPILLRARINACLEKKQLREQEQATYRALVESQKHLAAELAEAADYVRSLLPPPLTEGLVTTDWRFVTSTSLGGDSFGYHWIDEDHFAMYLLDVCGHGVGAALLSISAINVLRSQSLVGTDFLDPSAVLKGLNETFQMDRQNNMYFTIWYGVYNKAKREIRFARGGHPPAILVTGETGATAKTVELKAPGMVIGSMPGLNFRTVTQPMGPYSTLYLYSDGVYEVTRPDGTMWEFQDFVTELLKPPPPGQNEMDITMRHAQALQGRETFDDDFSMVKFVFH